MNFNLAFILSLFFFSFTQEIDTNKPHNFSKIIKAKDANYFSLVEKLRDLPFEEINTFYTQSISEKYKIGEIYALNTIGSYYSKKKDYKKALEYYYQALILCKKNKFYSSQMVCLNLIGMAYRNQDDIRNAIVYHQSVISLSKRIPQKTRENIISISIAENILGNIYSSLKQYHLAIEQFKKSITLQKQVKNLYGLAINYQNIGEAYENIGLLDKALENYLTSLSYNTKINSVFGKVICNNSITSIAIKQNNYSKAILLAKKNYPIADSIQNKLLLSKTLSNLGWAQVKLKDYKNAYNNLFKALTIAENLNIQKHIQIEVLHHISELFESKNNFKKAVSYYKKTIEVEDQIAEKRNSIYISNLTSKKNLQSQRNDFKELQRETEIKSLQLARNRNILIITLITIALLTAVLYSIYRQHLLKNDRKILLLEQQALQTQMNPHFVFNALNSIKLYIINNEQKNAVYYLNKFSKLIRNILEVSKVKEVSLKEELSTMSLYMSIENIRFDNNINYIEEIHPNLNTDTIKLPPLVLQPFIENAIWHGLSPKEEGKKEIILSAKKIKNELIEISITDNGIGREAALEIKKNKSLKRKSVGIELTKERLTTYCNEYLTEFSLTYYDLKDPKGNPTGTKVSLQIPLG